MTANITLYAKWTAVPKYTVTFNSNGGSAVAAVQVESGKALAAPTAPTKAGYTFDGWFKDSALKTSWNFTADKVTANTTLYARWAAVSVGKIYTVVQGDSLWEIAKRELGDGNRYTEIMTLNSLTSLTILVGQQLLIPPK